jgi:NurA-like 5'-3' nuclease
MASGERVPPFEKGHVVVAAVRVLMHRSGRAPREEEVAEMLDFPADLVRSLVRGLAARGIVRVITNPFETRVELGDYMALEALPRESEGAKIETELEEFHARYRDRQAEMGKLFSDSEISKRKEERVKNLDEEFKKFRKRTGRDD